MDKANTLDLDALFGVQDPLTTTYQGKTHTLLRPAALGPLEHVKLDAFTKRTRTIQDMGDAVTEAQAAELVDTINEAMAIFAPTLPAKEMPFAHKLGVLMFYYEKVAPKDAANGAEKKMNRHARRAGAKRSRNSRSGTALRSKT